MPGVIVDRYGSVVVIELTTAGADRWRESIADACLALDGVDTVYERSDVDVRQREGLELRAGLVRGAEPPERIVVHEDGAQYFVDVRAGHKTGFYLDQRNARTAIAAIAADRKSVV